MPLDTIPVRLRVSPEPRLHWVRVESVRVSKAVDDAGRNLPAMPHVDAVTLPTRVTRVRGGAIVVNGRGVILAPGQASPSAGVVVLDRPTQVVARLKAGENPPERLREIAGVIRGVVRTEPEELVALTGLGGKLAETESHGVSLKAGRITKPGDEYAMDVTLNLDPTQVQPVNSVHTAAIGTVVVRNGGRLVARPQGGAVVVNGFNAARPGGLTLTGADGKAFNLRVTRQSVVVSPSGSVEYLMALAARPTEPGQGRPVKLSFHGTRTKPVEVPFRLTDVPVASGQGPTAPQPTPLPARR
jgi:hypothetical protein